ncbi:MAG: four helix bundle protein [Prevotella sp.]|nr:four helix bundle protein [Prevotella sp.]MBR0265631.1 four helix bundle protein [Prevotella sp.]
MAQSEDLPIFKSAYDLLEKLVGLSKELPKFFRYSLGTRMVDLCLDLLGQVYRANMSQEVREQVLTDLLIDYRQLLMLLRVVYRQKAISSGRYVELISLLDSIGRQATGWKQKTARGASPSVNSASRK